MKKFLLVILCLILTLFVFGCTQKETVQDEISVDTTEAAEDSEAKDTAELSETIDSTETEEEKKDENVITMYSSADFAAVYVEDVLERSDLAVRARYHKDIESYAMGLSGLPATISEFEVLEVVKGEYDKETINVHYYGGRITLYDQIQALKEETVNKRGYGDISEEEAKNTYIECAGDYPSPEFNTSDEYLLMMSYDPERDTYFIMCEGYGAPVIEDGAVYNAKKDEFVDMTALEETLSES